MSHITDVKLQVKDLDAVKMVAEILGFEFREGQKTYAWYGRFMNDSDEGRRVVQERGEHALGKCDHALRPKVGGGYEIGLVANAEGSYDLLYDSWGSGQRIEELAGKGLSRIRQEYAVAVTQRRVEKTMARQGFKMTRETLGDGKVRVRLQRRTT